MALTVKDILELPSGQKMQLLAGAKGLDRPVISVEIADYEFAPDIQFVPEADFDLQESMEAGSFIITSFLFAKDDPALILSAVQTLEQMGMAGLAYKQIIYQDLPREVLDFAEKKKFPILSFGKTVWFENIIFDIMYAVQFDDRVYLSEEKIDAMLSGQMSRPELDIIRKGISLKLQPFVSAVYISGKGIDAGRLLRSFYLQKGLHSKGLMARYGDGLFLIITSARADHESHDLIRREIFEVLGIPAASGGMEGLRQAEHAKEAVLGMGMSDVHGSGELDKAFRESWFCRAASVSAGKTFERFGKTGIYRVLLPAMGNEETPAFAEEITGAFAGNADLVETAGEYVRAGGEIARTAEALHCHQNTVRYRLGRIRELAGLEEVTDAELYLQLKTALAIEGAKAGQASGD